MQGGIRRLPTLRGITWNHTRGYTPLSATAQRFGELDDRVIIEWEKRSLQQFADYSIGDLAKRFDLIVLDHPWMGHAANKDVLVPLDQVMSASFLSGLSENSVGLSYQSYRMNHHQYAVPIDAATPVAAYRVDSLQRVNASVPETWDDVLNLARRGLVLFPAIAIDSLMNFYMLCCTLGEEPFHADDKVISHNVGRLALDALRELASYCSPEIFHSNPIAVYEKLAGDGEWAYCPFAYGYSNYAREGYGKHVVRFTDLVRVDGRKLISTLGGTGLAISTNSPHIDTAVRYVQYVSGEECQRTLYVENGGQPGHRAAWLDRRANQLTHDFFQDTLPAFERAYLRPRYDGYLVFQDQAGDFVRSYMKDGGEPEDVLFKLDELYLRSKGGKE